VKALLAGAGGGIECARAAGAQLDSIPFKANRCHLRILIRLRLERIVADWNGSTLKRLNSLSCAKSR
jgi:hypothetical protein